MTAFKTMTTAIFAALLPVAAQAGIALPAPTVTERSISDVEQVDFSFRSLEADLLRLLGDDRNGGSSDDDNGVWSDDRNGGPSDDDNGGRSDSSSNSSNDD